MRVVFALSLAGWLAASGCDLIVEPAPTEPVGVAFQLHESVDSSFTPVLARVDRVWLELERGGETVDTIVPARVDAGVVTTRVALTPPPGSGAVRVRAELRYFGERLFTGVAAVSERPGSSARIFMTPIEGYMQIPRGAHRFDQLGGSLALWSEIYFATDDRWPGVEARWTSDDPDVVAIEQGAVAVPRGNGSTTLRATFESLERTMSVTVSQVPAALTGVAPADTTVSVGDRLHLRAFGEDIGGHPLLPGADVAWEYEGGLRPDSAGSVTAIGSGPALAHAVSGAERRTATITVLPPPEE